MTNINNIGSYYQVEDIVGSRIFNGKKQYLVKWLYYPSEENTWEPHENLKNVLQMVNHYQKTQITTTQIHDSYSSFIEGFIGNLTQDQFFNRHPQSSQINKFDVNNEFISPINQIQSQPKKQKYIQKKYHKKRKNHKAKK